MIAYYNPNLTFISLIKAIFTRNAERNIIDFFQKYTQKEYILITNSCRAALYLAYKAIPVKGEVITNPLTCQIALEPIIKSGNKIIYTDINKDSLTMQTEDLTRLINEKTIAVQAIHQGGFLCNMAEIRKSVGSKKIYIIEDCAQGLFSSFNNYKPGEFSDVICFSLIKNAYGIGGGILATNDANIYKMASEVNNVLNKASLKLILFRIVRNILETNRKYWCFELFYRILMYNRNKVKCINTVSSSSFKIACPSKIEIKVAWEQLQRSAYLNEIRKQKGKMLAQKLKSRGLINNYKDVNSYDSAFTKFILINSKIESKADIIRLNNAGIEAKHLEHKFNQYYQLRIDYCGQPELISNINECPHYFELHDKLISLPLTEGMSEKIMDVMVNELNNVLKHE